MKTNSFVGKFALGLTLAGIVSVTAAEPKKVLVVSVTTGFRHSSIPTAEKVLEKLGQDSGAFTVVDFARQPAKGDNFDAALKESLAKLSPANLKNYDAVIFANTTGDLPLPDKQGFVDWVKNGGAFIGMHSASDTFHGFRPFIEMIGGEFQSHGAQAEVEAINQDKNHPACRHFGDRFTVFDEIYIMKSFTRSTVHGLLTLDKEPNRKTPGDYPIAWCKEFGKGKVFYTSLGHREDVWDPEEKNRKNPKEVAEAYQKHILGGIKWALGLEKGDATPGK